MFKSRSSKLTTKLGGKPRLTGSLARQTESVPEKKARLLGPEENTEKKDVKTDVLEPRIEDEESLDAELNNIKKLISKTKKTDSEKAFLQLKHRRLKERISKKMLKTHREKIKELNEHLSNLPVHFDIPRVGPG